MTGVGLGGETPLEAEMADTGTEEQGGEDEYHHHLLAPRQKEHRVRINRVRDHASAGRDGTAKCAPPGCFPNGYSPSLDIRDLFSNSNEVLSHGNFCHTLIPFPFIRLASLNVASHLTPVLPSHSPHIDAAAQSYQLPPVADLLLILVNPFLNSSVPYFISLPKIWCRCDDQTSRSCIRSQKSVAQPFQVP
jgi:hypothetical protein